MRYHLRTLLIAVTICSLLFAAGWWTRKVISEGPFPGQKARQKLLLGEAPPMQPTQKAKQEPEATPISRQAQILQMRRVLDSNSSHQQQNDLRHFSPPPNAL